MQIDGQGKLGGGAKIAVLDVEGLLLNLNFTGPYSAGENPVDVLREKLDMAAADEEVCAVVLRINSPGGFLTATDIIGGEARRFQERAQRPRIACLMVQRCHRPSYL